MTTRELITELGRYPDETKLLFGLEGDNSDLHPFLELRFVPEDKEVELRFYGA